MKRKARKQNNILPVLMIGAGVLLVLALLVWLAVSQGAGSGAPAAQNNDLSGITRVPLAESKKAFDEQSAVILDVRDPESFAAEHIPGAVNIPLGELEARAGELDQQDWIIAYCT